MHYKRLSQLEPWQFESYDTDLTPNNKAYSSLLGLIW